MNILVVSSHQDDEVIGCGGTIIKHHKKGDKIWIVYITAGWSGIPKIKSKKEATKIREKEAQNACKILGVEKTIFIREKDRSISETGKIIQKLIKIIREIKPNFIYAPHPEEKDVEHKITYKTTKEASWLSKSAYFPNLGNPTKSIEAIYLYEVWTPMKDFFKKEDITNVIDIKTKALSMYKSQIGYLNLIDATIGLNMYRGSMIGTTKRFAEVFQIEKA
jgi:LmbE family N-acetylglucosaminyl deacetylase